MIFLLPKGTKNLAGRVFGELTPVRIVRVTPADGAVWLCSCSCAGTREVPAKNLTSGRVTRCTPCANKGRTTRLHAAYKESLGRRGDSNSSIQRNWQLYLPDLTPQQRNAYDEFIGRREQAGVEITDRIRASAVEAAMALYPVRLAA